MELYFDSCKEGSKFAADSAMRSKSCNYIIEDPPQVESRFFKESKDNAFLTVSMMPQSLLVGRMV